jgi:hypothetical protein
MQVLLQHKRVATFLLEAFALHLLIKALDMRQAEQHQERFPTRDLSLLRRKDY